MKPFIKSILVSFNDNLDIYKPKNMKLFNEVLCVSVADSEDQGEYVFYIRIESVGSISSRIKSNEFVGYSIVAEEYDAIEIRHLLDSVVKNFTGSTWDEFINYFSKFAVFENDSIPF